MTATAVLLLEKSSQTEYSPTMKVFSHTSDMKRVQDVQSS